MPSDRRLEREAAKRRRHRRGQAIAALSSLIVLGGLATLILTSPGWPEVQETFFNWSVFKDSFPDVAKAFWLDVKIFVVAELAILVVGLVVAMVRIARSPAMFPLRLLSVAYVDGIGAGAKIHLTKLSFPGEWVRGPESWLYPIQPPH